VTNLAKPAISLQISQHIAGIRANEEATLWDFNVATPFSAIDTAVKVEIINRVLNIVFRADQIETQASAPGRLRFFFRQHRLRRL